MAGSVDDASGKGRMPIMRVRLDGHPHSGANPPYLCDVALSERGGLSLLSRRYRHVPTEPHVETS